MIFYNFSLKFCFAGESIELLALCSKSPTSLLLYPEYTLSFSTCLKMNSFNSEACGKEHFYNVILRFTFVSINTKAQSNSLAN